MYDLNSFFSQLSAANTQAYRSSYEERSMIWIFNHHNTRNQQQKKHFIHLIQFIKKRAKTDLGLLPANNVWEREREIEAKRRGRESHRNGGSRKDEALN